MSLIKRDKKISQKGLIIRDGGSIIFYLYKINFYFLFTVNISIKCTKFQSHANFKIVSLYSNFYIGFNCLSLFIFLQHISIQILTIK